MNTIPTKSQIQWQCRRGMLELDVMLEKFLNRHFDALSDSDKRIFAELLKLDDPTLYDWLVIGHEPLEGSMRQLISLIRG